MDSIIERAGQMAKSDLKQVRWALGINGALSVAFGVVILIWPGISLYALTLLFGAFTAANGIIGLGTAIGTRMKTGRGWLVVTSLLAIGIGIAVLVWPNISALALLYVIGAYAIAFGILGIGGAFSLPFDGGDKALIVLMGLISILFGVVIFASPGEGALVLLALIAAFALIVGISELVVAIGGKRLLERDLKNAVARTRPQPASS